MNVRMLSRFFLLILLMAIFSCSGNPELSRKPVSQITIENANNLLYVGQDLILNVNTRIKDGKLEKTRVFIDDQLVSTQTQTAFKQVIEKYSQVGIHVIKVVATKSDGTAGINYREFKVLSDQVPENYGYRLIESYPHSTKNFTEGLEIHNGFLYEGTGENGSSAIYKTNIQTGKTLQSVALDKEYFGEGITIFNDKIYQLTYKHKKGFIYDLNSFKQMGTFNFESEEGWGMTHDDKYLIMSDGSHTLTYLDPVTLAIVKKLQVADNKELIELLNELEYRNGYIYANVWTTNFILKIDASTGKVIQKIDLTDLLGTYQASEKIDYLNGIAINPSNGNLYVTGKYWPRLFQIEPVKKE